MSVSSKIISTLLAVTAMTAASTTVLAAPAKKPTVAEAERFIADAEVRLKSSTTNRRAANGSAQNFITDDTEAITARPTSSS
jgi:peptidyl-dipeptidase A